MLRKSPVFKEKQHLIDVLFSNQNQSILILLHIIFSYKNHHVVLCKKEKKIKTHMVKNQKLVQFVYNLLFIFLIKLQLLNSVVTEKISTA